MFIASALASLVLMAAALATVLATAQVDLLRDVAGDLQRWQHDLHRDLAAGIRHVRDQGVLAAGGLVSISFLYGAIHAAGPGHGKAVISTYVLADARNVRRGLLLAWAAALLQAFTAIGLVIVVVQVVGAATREAQPVAMILERIGYALVAAVGVAVVWAAVRRGMRRTATHHHHDHAACGHSHAPSPEALGNGSWWRAAGVVLSVGLRPCTGALLVLGFSHALGLFAAGVAATFAMAVGTALAVSILALLALGSRNLVLRFAAADSRWLRGAEIGLALLGGSVLVLAGTLMLAGTFQPPQNPLPFR
ncbi:MAG TPA: hypothetical protein VK943_08095 [Arenibaculum sp.]|nr:hypothetical protein [Arenibaculum sp.]